MELRMKRDLASIYERELLKLENEGWGPSPEELDEGWTIEDEASGRAEEIYWDLVDQGRQAAKDREIDR
jgi:hypothetical protein